MPVGVMHTVAGRGDKNLLCGLESELRLGRGKEKNGEDNRGDERTHVFSCGVPGLSILGDSRRCRDLLFESKFHFAPLLSPESRVRF